MKVDWLLDCHVVNVPHIDAECTAPGKQKKGESSPLGHHAYDVLAQAGEQVLGIASIHVCILAIIHVHVQCCTSTVD